MTNFLGNSMDTVCVPCMDGIIIFSTSLDEHIESAHRVLRLLREHGVKLKPWKRKIFKREVTFLARVVPKRATS